MSHKMIEKLTTAKSLAAHKMAICDSGRKVAFKNRTPERYNLWVARYNRQSTIWWKLQHYINQFAQAY